MRTNFVLAAASFVAVLAGCSLGLSPRPDTKDTAGDVTVPTPSSAASTQVRELPGVDLSTLEQERKQAFFDIAGRLYAPCTEHAVSLVQCVDEKRGCASCVPAANFLVRQVERGVPKAQAAAAVNARFSLEAVKAVELADSPTKGPANAPVTIVVFSDFQCPACKATLPLLDETLKKFPGDVRLVHKFYPLKKHTRARYAAYAAAAAQKQGKYWEMERILFENQEALSDRDLEGYADKLKLDMAQFKADYASDAIRQLVDRDIAAGDAAGLTFTPYILINGRVFDPAYFKFDRDFDDWITSEATIVRAQRAPSK